MPGNREALCRVSGRSDPSCDRVATGVPIKGVKVDQGHYQDPMAEIALALAMGFFAIMVLTMVSMGSGGPGVTAEASEDARIVAAALRPASDASPQTASISVPERDELVIYYEGRYLDASLQTLEPAGLASRAETSPIVLAIHPELSLIEAMDARAKIDREDVVVATLDERWLQALQGSLQ